MCMCANFAGCRCAQTDTPNKPQAHVCIPADASKPTHQTALRQAEANLLCLLPTTGVTSQHKPHGPTRRDTLPHANTHNCCLAYPNTPNPDPFILHTAASLLP
jgi:hypothetical protein